MGVSAPGRSDLDYAEMVAEIEPTPGSTEIGTDINRNFGYHWGENPLNASPDANTYRGPSAWSTPEARAYRDYVDARVIGGIGSLTCPSFTR